jgi:hypothetical protein
VVVDDSLVEVLWAAFGFRILSRSREDLNSSLI